MNIIKKHQSKSTSENNLHINNDKDPENVSWHVSRDVSWDENIENNIKQIGEKSKGYKIMHIKQARKITKKYNWLMYMGICLGPLSALFSGIGAIINPSTAPVEFPIASACAGFLSGIVVAVTKFGKFEERSSHHKIAASKYTSLESNVRRQLILCRTDRVNAGHYLEWIGNSFDDLFLASPLVANRIYKDYVKVAHENGMYVPDEYEITINVDEKYQLKKYQEMKDSSVIDINIETQEKIEDKTNNLNTHNTFKGTTEIKRTKTLSHFTELNKFSDGKMAYEMERMLGLK